MSEQLVSFRDKPIYPILFMLSITVVFVGLLSVFYRSTEKGIEQYKRQTYQLQIITLFADTLSTLTGKEISSFTDRAKVQENYDQYIYKKCNYLSRPPGLLTLNIIGFRLSKTTSSVIALT